MKGGSGIGVAALAALTGALVFTAGCGGSRGVSGRLIVTADRSPSWNGLTALELPIPRGERAMGASQAEVESVRASRSLAVFNKGRSAVMIGATLDGRGVATLVGLRKKPVATVDTIEIGRAPTAVAIDPKGQLVAALTSEPGELWIIETDKNGFGASSGAPIELFFPRGARLNDLAWSPDGESLAVASDAGVAVFERPTASEGATMRLSAPMIATKRASVACTWSKDGKRLYVGTKLWREAPEGVRFYAAPSGLVVIDAARGAVVHELSLPQGPTAMALNPKGDRLVIATEAAPDPKTGEARGRLLLVEVGRGGKPRVLADVEGPEAPTGVAWDKRGRHALVSDFAQDEVLVYDARRDELRFTGVAVQTGDGPVAIAVVE